MKRYVFITEITLILMTVIVAGLVGICSASGIGPVPQKINQEQSMLDLGEGSDSSIKHLSDSK